VKKLIGIGLVVACLFCSTTMGCANIFSAFKTNHNNAVNSGANAEKVTETTNPDTIKTGAVAAQIELPLDKQAEITVEDFKNNMKTYIVIPAGAIVNITSDILKRSFGGGKTVTDTASTHASSIVSDEVGKTGISTSSPGVSVDSDGPKIDTSISTVTTDVPERRDTMGSRILIGLGGIAIIVGLIITAITKQPKLGIPISVGGGIVIFLGYAMNTIAVQYPWIMPVGFVLLVLGAIGFVFYAHAGKKKDVSLTTMIKTIDALPEDVGKTVKDGISEIAKKSGNYGTVKGTVSAIKRKEKLIT